jgi:hypothetical protein
MHLFRSTGPNFGFGMFFQACIIAHSTRLAEFSKNLLFEGHQKLRFHCSDTFEPYICAYSVHREESNGNGFIMVENVEKKLFSPAHPQIFNKSGQLNETSAKKLMNCSPRPTFFKTNHKSKRNF